MKTTHHYRAVDGFLYAVALAPDGSILFVDGTGWAQPMSPQEAEAARPRLTPVWSMK